MKNNIATLIVIIMMAVFARPTMAQSQTFNGATAPQATFQSTNTMMGSGSRYASQPRLSAGGQAIYSTLGTTSSGPHRMKMEGEGDSGGMGAIDPDEYEEKPLDTPIGDAVLPFTLMCLLAAGVVYLRRRRA